MIAVTTVTEIATKQDMSRFTRAHADGPITWTTQGGPGGTLIILEHEQDRSTLTGTAVAA